MLKTWVLRVTRIGPGAGGVSLGAALRNRATVLRPRRLLAGAHMMNFRYVNPQNRMG